MYKYQEVKPEVFKEQSQQMFLSIRDKAKKLASESGCFTMEAVIKGQTGDTWTMMACVDRLAELGEITEVTVGNTMGQHRIFKLTPLQER